MQPDFALEVLFVLEQEQLEAVPRELRVAIGNGYARRHLQRWQEYRVLERAVVPCGPVEQVSLVFSLHNGRVGGAQVQQVAVVLNSPHRLELCIDEIQSADPAGVKCVCRV